MEFRDKDREKWMMRVIERKEMENRIVRKRIRDFMIKVFFEYDE